MIGLGVSRPFGVKSQWDNPDTFTGRYICLECQISSWSINPTIAYKVADRLSVGAGLDVRLSKFSLSRRLVASPNPFPVPTDVAELTLDSGTDTGSASTSASSRAPPRTCPSASPTATR